MENRPTGVIFLIFPWGDFLCLTLYQLHMIVNCIWMNCFSFTEYSYISTLHYPWDLRVTRRDFFILYFNIFSLQFTTKNPDKPNKQLF